MLSHLYILSNLYFYKNYTPFTNLPIYTLRYINCKSATFDHNYNGRGLNSICQEVSSVSTIHQSKLHFGRVQKDHKASLSTVLYL